MTDQTVISGYGVYLLSMWGDGVRVKAYCASRGRLGNSVAIFRARRVQTMGAGLKNDSSTTGDVMNVAFCHLPYRPTWSSKADTDVPPDRYLSA